MHNLLDVGKDTRIAPSLPDALLTGFAWAQAPEGHSYWLVVYNRAQLGEFDTSDLAALVRAFFEAKEKLEIAEKALREAVCL